MAFVPDPNASAGENETASYSVFRDNRILVDEAGRVPQSRPEGVALGEVFGLGFLDGRACLAANVSPDASPPQGFQWKSLRGLVMGWDEMFASVAGRAAQIAHWDSTHRYCGRCGSPMNSVAGERARHCAKCDLRFYPRISPCVAVRVDRGDEVLLARNATFPLPFFSLVAGFVDAGETLEQCIAREVREEVGVEVRNVKYFASQPWPFPHSLMIGFTAEWTSGEVKPDGTEIVEAGWYRADAMPMVPPSLSLSGRMIEAFVQERTKRTATITRARAFEAEPWFTARDGIRVRIRLVRSEDAPGMLEMERAIVAAGQGVVKSSHDLPADAAGMSAELIRWIEGPWTGPRGALFVAEHQGRIVGSVSIARLRPERVRHAAQLGIGVVPDWQGRGIGRALLEQAVAWAVSGPGRGLERIDLAVIADNVRAVKLYESVGFVREGLRERFVRDPDGAFHDDMLMVLRIAASM